MLQNLAVTIPQQSKAAQMMEFEMIKAMHVM